MAPTPLHDYDDDGTNSNAPDAPYSSKTAINNTAVPPIPSSMQRPSPSSLSSPLPSSSSRRQSSPTSPRAQAVYDYVGGDQGKASCWGGWSWKCWSWDCWGWRCWSWWLFLMRCLHTLAVAGLAIAVTYLFWQVQALQTIVNNDQATVEALREQVQTQQHEEIQQLSEEVKQEQSNSLYQAAGTFTILTCLLTMFHMSTHLQNMHEPMVQRKIITILWMSPIYGVTSFLSLIFPCKCIFFVFGCIRRTFPRRNHSLSSYSLSFFSFFVIELLY